MFSLVKTNSSKDNALKETPKEVQFVPNFLMLHGVSSRHRKGFLSSMYFLAYALKKPDASLLITNYEL